MSPHNFAVQRQSETFRTGEPIDHYMAELVVKLYLETKEKYVELNRFVLFPTPFIIENMLEYASHTFDIYTDRVFIEIDGDLDYNYGYVKGRKTKHSHKQQMINDGVVKRFIEEYRPLCTLVRLKKEEVNNLESSYSYLQSNLKDT